MKKKLFIALLGVAILFGCNSEKKKEHSAAFSGDDEETEINAENSFGEKNTGTADVDLTDLSDDASQTVSSMEQLNQSVEKINSPDKLMESEQEYESKLAETYAAIERAKDPDEKAKLNAYLNEIQHNYHSKKNEYSMPANGIIQKIEKLTKRLEGCQSKDDFLNILEPRISYFNNLTKLYTLVEEDNRRQEVREMAEKLNVLFQKKKAQFGVEY